MNTQSDKDQANGGVYYDHLIIVVTLDRYDEIIYEWRVDVNVPVRESDTKENKRAVSLKKQIYFWKREQFISFPKHCFSCLPFWPLHESLISHKPCFQPNRLPPFSSFFFLIHNKSNKNGHWLVTDGSVTISRQKVM